MRADHRARKVSRSVPVGARVAGIRDELGSQFTTRERLAGYWFRAAERIRRSRPEAPDSQRANTPST